MTLEQFNAAGQLGKAAADAVPTLRGVPGYVGISLRDGAILVEGSGAELQARVDELNRAGAATVLVPAAPAARPADAAAPAPADAASAPAPAVGPAAPTLAAPAGGGAGLVAISADQLFQAYLREVGPAGLQAVASTGGRFVIRTGGLTVAEAVAGPSGQAVPGSSGPSVGPAPGKISAAAFVARYANVELEEGAPVKTEEDLFGGEGYVTDNGFTCSAGFGAYAADGLPLVLTAGHCAHDGTATTAAVEPPTAATAGGARTTMPAALKTLGKFGFSQFGGVNNSPVVNPKWATGDAGNPGNVGTDIAVIEQLNSRISVQPAVTRWDNAADPASTSVKIIGTFAPFVGQNVCRSGRTTGWSCGKVAETGIYVAGGATPGPDDSRAFRGFLSKDVKSGGGDSGGPWISGNYAVGTHTGAESVGGKQVSAIATTLEDALTYVPGPVQLQLFLNKPELVASAKGGTVVAGDLIKGHVPAAPATAVAAGSKVRIAVGTQVREVPVDAAGNWSFPAPLPTGPVTFTAETINGFSRSGAATFTLDVAPVTLPAPVTMTPGGAPVPGAGSVTVTGMDGAAATIGEQRGPAALPAAPGAETGVVPVVPSAAVGQLPDVVPGLLLPEAGRPALGEDGPSDPPAGAPAPAGDTPPDPAAAPAVVRAGPPAAAPTGPSAEAGQPAADVGWMVPAAGLAGGAVLLASALLILGRRRAVRTAPPK